MIKQTGVLVIVAGTLYRTSGTNSSTVSSWSQADNNRIIILITEPCLSKDKRAVLFGTIKDSFQSHLAAILWWGIDSLSNHQLTPQPDATKLISSFSDLPPEAIQPASHHP